jgi:protein-arginine kinase activator protein McsA
MSKKMRFLKGKEKEKLFVEALVKCPVCGSQWLESNGGIALCTECYYSWKLDTIRIRMRKLIPLDAINEAIQF